MQAGIAVNRSWFG